MELTLVVVLDPNLKRGYGGTIVVRLISTGQVKGNGRFHNITCLCPGIVDSVDPHALTDVPIEWRERERRGLELKPIAIIGLCCHHVNIGVGLRGQGEIVVCVATFGDGIRKRIPVAELNNEATCRDVNG